MYKTKIILILSVFVIIEAVTEEDPKIVNSASASQEDVNLLTQITFKEALPIVVYEDEQNHSLKFPTGLVKAKIQKGRLVSGTEFQTIPKKLQIFLCPNPNSEDKCLEPKTFEESDTLQCDLEPMSFAEKNQQNEGCGQLGKDTMITLVYKICPSKDPYTYETENLPIFSFCRGTTIETTLFVEYEIVSANLLSEKLLQRERNLEFELSKQQYEFINIKYDELLSPKVFEATSEYKFQQLVPAEDMALAAFRKTTYHYLNVEFQLIKLFELWNEIHTLIRNNAKETFAGPHKIITGVWEFPEGIPYHKEKGKMYNIWIKIVIDKKTQPFKGLAIMMNNYIPTNKLNEITGKEITEHSTHKPYYIDKLCDKTISCGETLRGKFDDIGGQLRCCEVTKLILGLFYPQKNLISVGEVLQIRDIIDISDTK